MQKCLILFNVCSIIVAISLRFTQSAYSENESDQSATIMLFLSSSPAIDVTVQVFSSDGTATGECTTLH